MNVESTTDVTTEPAIPSDALPSEGALLTDGYGGVVPPAETPVDPDNYKQQLEQYFAKDGALDDEGSEADADEAEVTTDETDSSVEADADKDAAPASAADPWDPRLISAAQHFGFTPEEARAFPNPQALHNTLLRMQQALTAANPKPAGDATSATEQDESVEDDGLDPEIYPPEIVRHIRDLRQQVTQLKSQLHAQVEAPRQNEFFDWFDDQCSQSGIAALGTGRRGELKEPEFEARNGMVQFMHDLQRRFPTENREQLYERAKLALFPGEVKAQQTKEISKKLNRRAAQAVGRPHQSGSPALDDEQGVLSELERERRKMLRANGDL